MNEYLNTNAHLEAQVSLLTAKRDALKAALEAKDAEIAELKGKCLSMAMELTGIPKYKALCDQLGTALDGHCAPLPGYEQEHIDALTAWREMK